MVELSMEGGGVDGSGDYVDDGGSDLSDGESDAGNDVKDGVSHVTLVMAKVSSVMAEMTRVMADVTLLQDWRLAMTITKWCKLAVELLVCAVHPLPFPTFSLPTTIVRDLPGGLQELVEAELPLNGVLTILMFLRVYLLGRFVVVHSKLFLDTSVQSLGALSRVKINGQFVFRALMSTSPMVVLGTWMLGTFVINSWTLRVCEVYSDSDSHYTMIGQSMWLTAVTFLTVGYGDLVPRSYCARVIASLTGVMGVGSMALCVAVLAKKLEQSRAQRYVHTFVQQVELDKQRKNAAANVVKQAFRIVRDLRSGRAPTSTVLIRHRSRLLQAVRAMHEAQFHMTALAEFTVGPVEVNTGVNTMQDTVSTIHAEQRALTQRVANLETLMLGVGQGLADLKQLLRDRTV